MLCPVPMRIAFPALALLLLAPLVPSASAGHWNDDSPQSDIFADSTCFWSDAGCVADYACRGGAPPQAVDFALYCAGRASSEGQDIAMWVPFFLWDWGVDFPTSLAESVPAFVHDEAQDDVDQANIVLCAQVWSFFCTNPVIIPEHIPIDDPFGAEPPLP